MRVGLILGILLPIALWGQSLDQSPRIEPFDHHFAMYAAIDATGKASQEKLASMVAKLERKRVNTKSDINFLRYLFFKTHCSFLKSYATHSSFSDLINKGDYNCLSGTALYSLILTRLGYDFEIIETNYHIFLIVHTGAQKVLFEVTDPHQGFISNEVLLNERLEYYKQGNVTAGNTSEGWYKFQFDLFEEVSLNQLTGLLYYNSAVKAYNEKNLVYAVELILKAYSFYSSVRLSEFSQVVQIAVAESNLDDATKVSCLQKLRTAGKAKSLPLALAY